MLINPEIRTTIIGMISAVAAIATFVHLSQRSLRNDLGKHIDGLDKHIDDLGKRIDTQYKIVQDNCLR